MAQQPALPACLERPCVMARRRVSPGNSCRTPIYGPHRKGAGNPWSPQPACYRATTQAPACYGAAVFGKDATALG